MKIHQIKFRNIASYGEKDQVIDFDKNEGNFFLLTGANGSGKSTIANVIKLGLYGKTGTKIKKSDVANRLNGEGYVSITLESKGKIIEIERWFSPNKDPRIIIDGIEQSGNLQHGKKNIENYIENEILEFPFHVFNNVLTLSVNDFKSLLRMTPSDKKAIFDRIFGFYILNEMYKILNDRIKIEKKSVDGFSHEINATKENLKNVEKKLSNLKESLEKESNEKVEVLTKKTTELNEALTQLNESRSDLGQKVEKIQDRCRSMEKEINSYNSEITTLKKQLKLYENDQCPTCGSALDTDEHVNLKNTLVDDLDEHTRKRDELKNEVHKIDDEATDCRVEINNLDKQINETKNKIRDCEREIKHFSQQQQSESTEQFESVIEDLYTTIDTKKKKMKRSEIRHHYLKQVQNIVGENGVKASILKNILPTLNSEISNYCDKLELPYRIQFDETFNSHIYSMGYDISDKTLSTGEMKKADFVCLVAIIKLMKMKYPTINLMFLDEIFSSLDMNAVNSVLYILKDLVKEYGLNVFVINHSPLPVNVFDYVIIANKNAGFSSITVEHT